VRPKPHGRAGTRLGLAALVLAGCAHTTQAIAPPPVPTGLLPTRLRRLSNAELERSVDTWLGITSRLAQTLPPDARQDGYTVHAEASHPPLTATRLARLAPQLAAASLEEGWAKTAQHDPRFLERAATLALRRSPSAEELGVLATLRDLGGPALVVAALLQSPSMLYLQEFGRADAEASARAGFPVHRLGDYEIASALSYAVWGGPPDEALLAAAQRGELHDGEAREHHMHRLLARSDARHHFRQFVLEWLEVDTLEQTTKSPELVPDYDRVKPHMLTETRAFVDEVMVHTGGSIPALLAGRFTSLDATMAAYYGLPGGTSGPRIGLSAHGRVGVLQHASFLAAHAHPDSPSPIKRGDFVLRRLLCVDFPRPSELDLQVVIPPATASQTTRERFEQHVSDPECETCHRRIDPLGFTFENFDAGGRRRTRENGHPVSSAADYPHAGAPVHFEDSVELAEWLAAAPTVHACVARQFFRYLSGQHDPAMEAAFVADLRELEPEQRIRLVEIVAAYVRSERFVLRRATPAAGEAT